MTARSVFFDEDEAVFHFTCARCQARATESKGRATAEATIAIFLKRSGWRQSKALTVICASCVDDLRREERARNFLSWLKRKRAEELRRAREESFG